MRRCSGLGAMINCHWLCARAVATPKPHVGTQISGWNEAQSTILEHRLSTRLPFRASEVQDSGAAALQVGQAAPEDWAQELPHEEGLPTGLKVIRHRPHGFGVKVLRL